eukprot:TRINITY_DN22485_c0_g1_i1.p1 TRINITY_DN22485_c0_g1~~TRINITY_DN22485_c0_g1_i1.p1  ORF type:complete len:147 (-),score=32.16 TRINITY_DN22485_c0_g1_i1:542-982(-)
MSARPSPRFTEAPESTLFTPRLCRPKPGLLLMDTLLCANLKAAVAETSGEPQKQNDVLRQERGQLQQKRWERQRKGFLRRMEVDSRDKHTYAAVCDLRSKPQTRAVLEQQRLDYLKHLQPAEPVVATYPSYANRHDYNRKFNWQPL